MGRWNLPALPPTVRYKIGHTLQETRLNSTRSFVAHELYRRWACAERPASDVAETRRSRSAKAKSPSASGADDPGQPAWRIELHQRSSARAAATASAALASLRHIATFLAPKDAAAVATTSHGAAVLWSALRPSFPLASPERKTNPNRGERRLMQAIMGYMRLVLNELQREWLLTLAPIDRAGAKQLRAQLCESTNNGTMPSFAVGDGALSGYIHGNFRARAMNIVLLLVHEPLAAPMLTAAFCDIEAASLRGAPPPPLRVVDVGGGPGFSPLGLHALALFLGGRGAVEGISAEYEAEWATSTEKLEPLLRRTTPRAAHRFCRCDLLEVGKEKEKEKEKETGEGEGVVDCRPDSLVRLVAEGTDMVIFSFVVVENARALRVLKWGPIIAVCSALKPGALAVFCDSTHRLWAEIILVSLQGAELDVAIPNFHSRYSLVLRKTATTTQLEDEVDRSRDEQWDEVQRQLGVLLTFARECVATRVEATAAASEAGDDADAGVAAAAATQKTRSKREARRQRAGGVPEASARFDAISAAGEMDAMIAPLRAKLRGRAAERLSARQLWTLALFTTHADDHRLRLQRERERSRERCEAAS